MNINELIGFQVETTAEWRLRKAKEFPNDERNLAAANELDRLAAEVSQLEGSPVHRRILKLMDLMSEDVDPGRFWPEFDETISAGLRAVGFHQTFGTGGELLEWYRGTLEGALRHANGECSEEILAERVAEDPAVKAAWKAYKDAYEKAEAEARNRLSPKKAR
jgi:hypothetical protein